MALIEKGRVCIITKGRDAGKEVVIKEVKDKTFVTIVGENVKERRSNIKHLEPLGRTSKKFTGKKVKVKAKKSVKPKKMRIKKKVAKKPTKRKAPKRQTPKKKASTKKKIEKK